MILILDSTYSIYKNSKLYTDASSDIEEMLLKTFELLSKIPNSLIADTNKVILLDNYNYKITSNDFNTINRKHFSEKISYRLNFTYYTKLNIDKMKELVTGLKIIKWVELGITKEELVNIQLKKQADFVNINLDPLKTEINNQFVYYISDILTEPLIRILRRLGNNAGYYTKTLEAKVSQKGKLARFERPDDLFLIYSERGHVGVVDERKMTLEISNLQKNYFDFLESITNINNDNQELNSFITNYKNTITGRNIKVILYDGDKNIIRRFVNELNTIYGPLILYNCNKDSLANKQINIDKGIIIHNFETMSVEEAEKLLKFLSDECSDKIVIIIRTSEPQESFLSSYKRIKIPSIQNFDNYLSRFFIYFAIEYHLIEKDQLHPYLYYFMACKIVNNILNKVPSLELLEKLVLELKEEFDLKRIDFFSNDFWYELKQYLDKKYENTNLYEIYNKKSDDTHTSDIQNASFEASETKTPTNKGIIYFRFEHIESTKKNKILHRWIITSNQFNKPLPYNYNLSVGIKYIAYLVTYYKFPYTIDPSALIEGVVKWHGKSKHDEHSSKGPDHTIRSNVSSFCKKHKSFKHISNHLKLGKNECCYRPQNEIEIEIIDEKMPKL